MSTGNKPGQLTPEEILDGCIKEGYFLPTTPGRWRLAEKWELPEYDSTHEQLLKFWEYMRERGY